MAKAGKWLWNFLTGKKERSREKDFESWSSLKLTPPPPPPAPPPSPPSTPKERRRRGYSPQRKRVSPNEQLGRPAAAVKSGFSALEKVAAIKIQASFRGFLARKALRALKGLVKLQAAVRGFLVRKQAAATIRSMQALLTVQVRARAMRVRMSREAHDMPPHQRRMMMKMMEPRVHQFHDKERNSNSRKSNTSKPHRTTSSEPSSSYMANTESWKAKARSQSVPRQRNGSPEASQLMKPRPSFDGKSLTRAAWASSVSSVAAREKVPWPIMLGRSRTNGSLFRFITA